MGCTQLQLQAPCHLTVPWQHGPFIESTVHSLLALCQDACCRGSCLFMCTCIAMTVLPPGLKSKADLWGSVGLLTAGSHCDHHKPCSLLAESALKP